LRVFACFLYPAIQSSGGICAPFNDLAYLRTILQKIDSFSTTFIRFGQKGNKAIMAKKRTFHFRAVLAVFGGRLPQMDEDCRYGHSSRSKFLLLSIAQL
jgi:hypothetical protein